MDWRYKKYYVVSFSWESYNYRLGIIKNIQGVKIRNWKNCMETLDGVNYQLLLSVPIEHSETLEYELRVAERRDCWCKWKEVKRRV